MEVIWIARSLWNSDQLVLNHWCFVAFSGLAMISLKRFDFCFHRVSKGEWWVYCEWSWHTVDDSKILLTNWDVYESCLKSRDPLPTLPGLKACLCGIAEPSSMAGFQHASPRCFEVAVGTQALLGGNGWITNGLLKKYEAVKPGNSYR